MPRTSKTKTSDDAWLKRKEWAKRMDEERKKKDQINKVKLRKHYSLFWDKHFPEGVQTVYSVGGNSDSSDSESSLSTGQVINPDLEKELVKKKIPTKFSCFKDLFQCILDHKDDFDDFFCFIDSSYDDYDEDEDEDETRVYHDKVEKAKTANGLFEVLFDYMVGGIDPIVLVRESNGLLVFLKNVRGF